MRRRIYAAILAVLPLASAHAQSPDGDIGNNPFRLEDAVLPERLTAADLRDPATLVAELPRRELDAAGRSAVMHGRPVPAGKGEDGRVALFADGQLVAVAERAGDVLKPRVVVADE